jgi:hypothetical protein
MVNALWRGLADVMISVHYAYIAYLVVGGFIAWRWRKTIWLHIAAAIWAVAIIVTKVPCPLTALQNQFRENAGQHPLSTSFINLYVRGTLYPADHQTLAQLAIAVVILTSWIGFRLRRPSRRPQSDSAARRPRISSVQSTSGRPPTSAGAPSTASPNSGE